MTRLFPAQKKNPPAKYTGGFVFGANSIVGVLAGSRRASRKSYHLRGGCQLNDCLGDGLGSGHHHTDVAPGALVFTSYGFHTVVVKISDRQVFESVLYLGSNSRRRPYGIRC